jgi:prepilin signal peptidase PulO-like enzyme (type II secretory pathway)
MTLIITIIFFVLGLIIGSFLNVVIYRYNTGRTFGGRSVCLSCNRILSWNELIPIGSFLAQRGKCRGCKTKISIQYPLVEIITGFIFAALYLKFQLYFWTDTLGFSATLAFYATLFSLLLVIAVYDLRHKIIPDTLVAIFGILAFLGMFFFGGGIFYPHIPGIYDLFAGPIIAFPFATLWLVSRGKWMGFGDAKLALGLGWMLSLPLGLSGLVMAFWIGAVFGILLLIFSKRRGIRSEIPFAPFLAIGALLAFLFNINLFPFF